MFYETETKLREALLKLPRESYARAQKMQHVFTVNGQRVIRQTRHYWLVNGNAVKLNKAVEMIPVNSEEQLAS